MRVNNTCIITEGLLCFHVYLFLFSDFSTVLALEQSGGKGVLLLKEKKWILKVIGFLMMGVFTNLSIEILIIILLTNITYFILN